MSKLSDRVRAGSEAAPWVVEAIVALEQALETVTSTLKNTKVRVHQVYPRPVWFCTCEHHGSSDYPDDDFPCVCPPPTGPKGCLPTCEACTFKAEKDKVVAQAEKAISGYVYCPCGEVLDKYGRCPLESDTDPLT